MQVTSIICTAVASLTRIFPFIASGSRCRSIETSIAMHKSECKVCYVLRDF